jgi:hypothetical protein
MNLLSSIISSKYIYSDKRNLLGDILNKQKEFTEAIYCLNLKKAELLINHKDVSPMHLIDWKFFFNSSSRGINLPDFLLRHNNVIADEKEIEKLHYIFNKEKDYLKFLKMANIEIDKDFDSYVRLALFQTKYKIFKLLISDDRIDPSFFHNEAIKKAFEYKAFQFVILLWDNKYVKQSLKNDDLELYLRLKKINLKFNVNNF